MYIYTPPVCPFPSLIHVHHAPPECCPPTSSLFRREPKGEVTNARRAAGGAECEAVRLIPCTTVTEMSVYFSNPLESAHCTLTVAGQGCETKEIAPAHTYTDRKHENTQKNFELLLCISFLPP